MKRKLQRVINKSGMEKCEICGEVHILVQHHIRGRNIPNPNSKSNLCNICSNCHLKVHSGLIIIEDRLLTTDGYDLIWHYKNEESITGNDANVHLF